MSAAGVAAQPRPMPVGVVEALGSLTPTAIFVSGWARTELPPRVPIVVSTTGRTVRGHMTVVRSDRSDVGPSTGFSGVAVITEPLTAAELLWIAVGEGHLLERYREATTFTSSQCTELLQAELARTTNRTAGSALSRFADLYTGRDSVAGTNLPIRLGIDDCVFLPGNAVFLRGWLFDPERLCRSISLADNNGSSRIDERWIAHHRLDVAAAMAADPRFRGFEGGCMTGFIVLAPATDADTLRLTLETSDDRLLHRPLQSRSGNARVLLRSMLAASDPSCPATSEMIDGLLAPVLASLPPRQRSRATSNDQHRLAIVIGCAGNADRIIPLLTTLSTDPAAASHPIIVSGSTGELSAWLRQLASRAAFLGLQLTMHMADDIDDEVDALLAGAAAASAGSVCLLPLSSVPLQAGWLGKLTVGSVAPALASDATLTAVFTETPGACLVSSDALASVAIPPLLHPASKWRYLLDELHASGAVMAESLEPLFAAVDDPPSTNDALLRRADRAALRLRAG